MTDILSRFSAEERIALKEFIHEWDLNRNRDWDVAELAILGPGRAMLKFFRAQDAIDPDVIQDRCGRFHCINGSVSNQDPKDHAAVLKTKWRQRENFYTRQNFADIRHVIDWLYVAARGRHAWLDNVDELGRPKKLMKCGSIQRLVVEADKFVQRRLPGALAVQPALTDADERPEHDLGLGHTLVRLLTPAALSAEGTALRHCIGLGSYDHKLDMTSYSFFSVRDPDGKRLASVELRAGVIQQCLGKFNSTPERYLLDLIDRSRESLGWSTWEEDQAQCLAPDQRRP